MVDGTDIGIATTSLDQRTLTVTTTDPSVADATSVVLGSTGGVQRPSGSSPQVQAKPQAGPRETPAPLDSDPAAAGPYSVVRADYDLGDQAETIRGFAGRKGEMRAAVWLPSNAPGKRPVAVFLHGRHEACSGGTPSKTGWPCGKNQTVIPSSLGYTAAAQALASNGVVVVSISANAINALDGTYADDGGALARGQLVLDHLALLQRADAGAEPRLSAELVGKLDLQHVGLMGHSRGGDGVVRAALLNAQRKQPFGIVSVMPLAPTDFGRTTLPDVDTAVVLPYCDGDVSDLQGQHFFDDSRTAYGDDVLRSSVLVMGANHNFFNSVWTPATYPKASSDDWWDDTDPVCGAKAKGTTRLSSSAQYAVGTSLVSGFFRLTLGGEQQFLPSFDGTGRVPSALGKADLRVTASLPGSARRDLAPFTQATAAVTTTGALRGTTCASSDGTAVPASLPTCVSGATIAPDYVPAWLAPSVTATPALHVTPTGTATGGEVRVAVDPAEGDLSSYAALSLRLTPDDGATTAADVSLRVTDATGAAASVRLSDVSVPAHCCPGPRRSRGRPCSRRRGYRSRRSPVSTPRRSARWRSSSRRGRPGCCSATSPPCGPRHSGRPGWSTVRRSASPTGSSTRVPAAGRPASPSCCRVRPSRRRRSRSTSTRTTAPSPRSCRPWCSVPVRSATPSSSRRSATGTPRSRRRRPGRCRSA